MISNKDEPYVQSIEIHISSMIIQKIQHIINIILNSCFSVTHIQELHDNIHPLYIITLQDDSRLLLRSSPLHHTLLLRHQQHILESTSLATRLIREETNVPILQIYHYGQSCNGSRVSYILSEYPKGISLKQAQFVLPHDIKRQTIKSLDKHLDAIHTIVNPSFTFGYLVADNNNNNIDTTTNYNTWRDFFFSMFYHLLRDAEDLMLILPYDHIRNALLQFEVYLNDVEIPQLTLCRVSDDQIFVDEKTGRITEMCITDAAIWGDPLMEMSTSRSILPKEALSSWNAVEDSRKEYKSRAEDSAMARMMLYACYQYVMDIVDACHRQDRLGKDVAPRRGLIKTLQEIAMMTVSQ